MTIFCGLSHRFDYLIAAIDMIAEEDELPVESVKSWLLQEEQNMNSCTADPTENRVALLSTLASNADSRSFQSWAYF